MNHEILDWILLLAGAIVAGGSVVAILVVRRSVEPLAALVGLGGAGMSLLAFSRLAASYTRPDAILWALAFLLAAASGGYALGSTLLHLLDRRPSAPPSTITPGPELPGVAVIVVACIEPDTYDPRATAGMLRSLSDEGLLNASIAALPFVFFAQKTRYRVVGDASPAQDEIEQLSDRLSVALGAPHHVSWATCSGQTGIFEAVARAVGQGYRRIVVAELSVATPTHLRVAKDRLSELRLDLLGVDLEFTAPLYDSERLLLALARRVTSASRQTGVYTGIILAGHGQAPQRARSDPEFDRNETAFLTRLRMMLLESGAMEQSVRIAWTDWGNPDVTAAVRHLAAIGCQRIVVMPATYPVDTLATRLDLEVAVRQARVDDSTGTVMLPAWRNDDALVEELRVRVLDATRQR